MVKTVIGTVRVGPYKANASRIKFVYRDAGPETRAGGDRSQSSPDVDDFYPLSQSDLERMNANEAAAQRRLLVLTHYSDGDLQCACCSERNYGFLSLDHVNGGGRPDRGDPHSGHQMLIKRLYANMLARRPRLPGYQVLCMNCNWGRGMQDDGICPHKKPHLVSAKLAPPERRRSPLVTDWQLVSTPQSGAVRRGR